MILSAKLGNLGRACFCYSGFTFQLSGICYQILRRIHAGLFDFIENDQSHKQDPDTQDCTDGHLVESHRPLPHEGETKALDHKDNRIQIIHPAVCLRHHLQWIDHTACIHPELDEEPKHHLKVAESVGYPRDQTAYTEPEGRHLDDQHGQHNDPPVQMDGGSLEVKPSVEDEEEQQTHRKSHQTCNQLRERDSKPGEINLVEHPLVRSEGARRLGDTLGEVTPADCSGEKEEDGRDLTSRDLGHLGEDHHEHQTLQQGLEYIPECAQHRLFVLRDEVTVGHEADHFPIIPQLFEWNVEKIAPRRDNRGPRVGRGRGGRRHGRNRKIGNEKSKMETRNEESEFLTAFRNLSVPHIKWNIQLLGFCQS